VWQSVIILVIALQAAFAQTRFEVASIRPNVSADRNSTWNFGEGGRFAGENIPPRFLIMTAFRLRDFQVSGLPGAFENEKYDIVAKAEGNPSEDQAMTMLQGLLADRFKFKYHKTTKTSPVYVLTAAKARHSGEPEIKAQASKEQNGTWFTRRNQIDAKGVGMAQFAIALSSQLDRPVLDKTRFTQNFDAHLDFDPEGTDGPTIFTALQEQLGMKLTAGKGPVEILVVDHIEKPSEN
jgi:uncharacterized protein (TIGR03435 family)